MSKLVSERTIKSLKSAKYMTIRNWLAKRIASGEFSCGEQLPSEHAIMAQFQVSRVTARQALDELKQQGLVESRRGKGYFVTRMTVVQSLQRLQSFGEMMAPLGLETSSNVIEVSEVAAGSQVATALKLAIDAPVIKIARQRLAGGTAMSLDISYFPVDIGRRLAVLDLSHADIFHLLEQQLDIELGYADLSIDIGPIEPSYSGFLGVSPDDLVLRIERLTYDDNGRPVDYERLYSRLDALTFQLRIPRW